VNDESAHEFPVHVRRVPHRGATTSLLPPSYASGGLQSIGDSIYSARRIFSIRSLPE
jgi:hypothetical protein